MDLKPGFKLTELGEIPVDWECLSLGSIGVFSKGQGIRKDEASTGEIPCVRYGELYTRYRNVIREFYSHISKEVAKTSKLVKKGDLLFAGSGETKEEIGMCSALVHEATVYAGGDIVVFSPRTGDSTFLGYLANAPQMARQKASLGQGDAVVHISANSLASLKLCFPPVSEQRAIAAALSDVDTLLTKLDQLITKKRDLKQAAMQQLLTGQTRLPGFSGEWTSKTIKEVTRTPVTDGPHMTPKFLADGIPFLSVNNLVNNKIDFENVRYISRDDHEIFSRKCKPQKHDLLLGKAASVGKIAIVQSDVEFNIWSPIALIRLNDSAVPLFVYYCMQGQSVLSQITLLTNSSSQGNIGMGDIEQLELLLPTVDEQNAIAKFLSDMDAELTAIEARRDKTRALKQGMMQELLTGRIRLV